MGGRHDAEEHPDDGRHQERDHRQLQRVGEELEILLHHRPLGADRAELSGRQILQEANVLDRERLVETQLHPDSFDLLGRRARLSHHDFHRVSGGEMDHQGDHDGDDEQHRDDGEQTASDIASGHQAAIRTSLTVSC